MMIIKLLFLLHIGERSKGALFHVRALVKEVASAEITAQIKQ